MEGAPTPPMDAFRTSNEFMGPDGCLNPSEVHLVNERLQSQPAVTREAGEEGKEDEEDEADEGGLGSHDKEVMILECN